MTHYELTTLQVLRMAAFIGASNWQNVFYYIIPIFLSYLLLGYIVLLIFLVFILVCIFILFSQCFVKRIEIMFM